MLKELFASIRDNFSAVPDKANADTWMDPKSHRLGDRASGDCEDFALLCWWHAQARGLPARLVLCSIPEKWPNNSHIVCEVNGWVLDVRQHAPIPRQHLPYFWHFISSPDLSDWYEITG